MTNHSTIAANETSFAASTVSLTNQRHFESDPNPEEADLTLRLLSGDNGVDKVYNTVRLQVQTRRFTPSVLLQ